MVDDVNLEGTLSQEDTGGRIPLDIKTAHVPVGQVHVIPERCKGCDFCVAFCPRDVLTLSQEINAKGYHYVVVAHGKEDACIDCQFCDLVCPEMAIYTVDLSKGESADGNGKCEL